MYILYYTYSIFLQDTVKTKNVNEWRIDFESLRKINKRSKKSPSFRIVGSFASECTQKNIYAIWNVWADYGSKRTKKKFPHLSFLEREVHESRLCFLPNFLEKSGKKSNNKQQKWKWEGPIFPWKVFFTFFLCTVAISRHILVLYTAWLCC